MWNGCPVAASTSGKATMTCACVAFVSVSRCGWMAATRFLDPAGHDPKSMTEAEGVRSSLMNFGCGRGVGGAEEAPLSVSGGTVLSDTCSRQRRACLCLCVCVCVSVRLCVRLCVCVCVQPKSIYLLKTSPHTEDKAGTQVPTNTLTHMHPPNTVQTDQLAVLDGVRVALGTTDPGETNRGPVLQRPGSTPAEQRGSTWLSLATSPHDCIPDAADDCCGGWASEEEQGGGRRSKEEQGGAARSGEACQNTHHIASNTQTHNTTRVGVH